MSKLVLFLVIFPKLSREELLGFQFRVEKQHNIARGRGEFLPRCMECRRGLAMRILSVRPSVCEFLFNAMIYNVSVCEAGCKTQLTASPE